MGEVNAQFQKALCGFGRFLSGYFDFNKKGHERKDNDLEQSSWIIHVTHLIQQ